MRNRVIEKNTETRRNRQTDIKRENMRKVYREKREVGGVGGKTKRNRNREIKKKQARTERMEKSIK